MKSKQIMNSPVNNISFRSSKKCDCLIAIKSWVFKLEKLMILLRRKSLFLRLAEGNKISILWFHLICLSNLLKIERFGRCLNFVLWIFYFNCLHNPLNIERFGGCSYFDCVFLFHLLKHSALYLKLFQP